MGRVIGIVIALWGLFLVSIFTVTLSNLFTFSVGELKAFSLGERLKMKDSLRVAAANVLGSSYKAKKTLQLYPDDKLAILSAINTHKR